MIFVSGSPFDEVQFKGKTLKPGQGNNAYIFPGIGLGAVACNAKLIDNGMILVAARALAEQVSEEDLQRGTLYPPLSEIRGISANIAEVVINYAYEHDLAQQQPKPDNVKQYLLDYMYDPTY